MNKNYFFRVMKLTMLLHLTAFLQLSLASYSQTITYEGHNRPLRQVLEAVKQQTDYEVLGNKNLFNQAKSVSIHAKNMTLTDFLDNIFKDQTVGYRIVDRTILLENKVLKVRPTTVLNLPVQKSLTGQILGKDRLPIVGATVAAEGIDKTTSGVDGRFTLAKMPANLQITVSSLGYETLVVKLSADRHSYTIHLKEVSQDVEEVVVTGYQVIKRDSYTGTAISMSGEELRRVNPQNVLQAMQVFDPSFKLLDNNLNGSDPNMIPNITVRGSSALPAGSNEILRRDNINSTVNMPAFFLDGYEVGVQKVLDLDMNRIESITILKDAAATAIYGSRAANGVILVTTKAPKDGQLRVTYSHETNINTPDLRDYAVLNAADKLNYEVLAGVYNSEKQNIAQDVLDELYYSKYANVIGGVDSYWISQPVTTAVGQKHGVYLEGGSPVFRYGIDLRYQTRPGVMKGSSRNQYSGGMNFSYNLNNKIKFQNELSITAVNGTESPYGDFADYVRMNPYYRMRDDNGNIIQNPETWTKRYGSGVSESEYVLNPLFNTTLNSFNTNGYHELIDNLSGDFELAKGLNLRGQLSLTKRFNKGDDYRSPLSNEFYLYETSRTDEKGSYTSSHEDQTFWDGNIRLNWVKQIAQHNINMVGGANIRTERADWRSFKAIGFPNDRFTSIGFAKGYAENASPSSDLSESRLFGTFLSTNYSFRNRYLMDATVRIDGSSKFGSNNRTAPFWSVGLGWNLHHESWFPTELISQLRVRATTGLTGSVQFSPYMSRTIYNYEKDNRYSSGIGAILHNYGNDNLSWQKTKSTDLGFDVGLFADRFFISPRVYRKLTKDILADISIAPSTGFSSYKENLGDMENKGFEVNMNWVTIRNQDWTLSFMANFVHNTNKIVRISNSLKSYNDRVNDAQEESDLQGVPLLRFKEGQSIDAIYAVPSLGIDPESGRELYVKADGSLTYDWNARDITVVANATPTAEGFFGGTLRYKQFMVVAYFQTRFGGETYNQTLVDRVENADPRYNVDSRVYDAKWKQSGDVAFYKNISDLGQTKVSSRFIQPDNLLALQSLNLSYDLNGALAKRLYMSNMRVGMTANDLFRWSTIRQERGINYPFARSISISLQASF